jgi:hypothetical protein
VIVNDPAVLAEVTAAFRRYEAALVGNDVAVLDALFWQDARVIRYGIAENLHGAAEIRAFRTARPAAGLARDLDRTVITTFGTDFATASTLFRRVGSPGRVGRQMQTWVRLPEGWRVVAAHVSVIDAPWAPRAASQARQPPCAVMSVAPSVPAASQRNPGTAVPSASTTRPRPSGAGICARRSPTAALGSAQTSTAIAAPPAPVRTSPGRIGGPPARA